MESRKEKSSTIKILMTLPAANYELPSSEQFLNLAESKRADRFKQQVIFPEVNSAQLKLKKEGKFDDTKNDVYTMNAPMFDRLYRNARNNSLFHHVPNFINNDQAEKRYVT